MPATALVRPTVGDRQAADRGLVQRLRTARTRLATQRFAERWAAGLLLAGGILVAMGTVSAFTPFGFRLHAHGWTALALMLASLLGAAGWTLARRPGLAATARELDRRAATRDRLATALSLSKRTGDELTPVERLAWEECTRFAHTFSVRRWTPFSLPRAVRFLPVPLVTLAFLLSYGHVPGLRPTAEGGADPALQQLVASQAEELKRAADAARQANDPAAKTLADELDRAARRLQGAAGQRDALRELSALEARLRQMQSERPSPAELAALAAALEREGSEAARAAADALRKGDPEEAARQLEKLLEQLKKGRGDSAAEALAQLARSMKEQAEKLTPEQRGNVARQMQQAAADAAEAQKNAGLLKKISELLRQAGAQAAGGNRGGSSGQNAGTPSSGQGSGGGGRQLTTQQLESLLRALEDMKGNLNGNGQGGGGSGGMRFTLEGFNKPSGQGGNRGGIQQAGPGPTGGAPGTEHDVGTADLGKDPVAGSPVPDRATRVQGQLGESESLQSFAPTTLEGAAARSGRGFREGIERAQAQAQEAVQQENIPLGSRFLVERYFKNIRPPE